MTLLIFFSVKFDKSFDSIALNNVQSDGEEEQVSTITVGDSPTKSPPDSNANKKTKVQSLFRIFLNIRCLFAEKFGSQ